MATADIDIIIEKVTDKSIREPNKFKVLIFNDNVTTVEFVIVLLMTVFKHTQASAIELTQKVHNEGKAVAGVYSHEIAEQKVFEAESLSQLNEFPLVIRMQPE
jgi:ATP-dependent Clp protease adaptor protein ClpS